MDLEMLQAQIWLREADAGRIDIEGILKDEEAWVYRNYLRYAARSEVDTPYTFYIDCDGTDDNCWEMARYIKQLKGRTVAVIDDEAISGGLIIALACDHRIAVSGAKFAWHGSPKKPGNDWRSDEDRVDFITERTTAPRELWEEKAESGKAYWFKAEEALEWGVIHEVKK